MCTTFDVFCIFFEAANYLNTLCRKHQISNVKIYVLQGGCNLFWKTYKDKKDEVEK